MSHVETLEFKTDVQKLLDLVTHSLYSNKEIFLRELISNASDAIDKLRFDALTNASLHEGDEQWRIKLFLDKEKNTLTISDNGYGMNKEDLLNNIGTIAQSGTKAFLENLKEAQDNPELIGQFGVGFYASFMVADKVQIQTRKAGEALAYQWTSSGDGKFQIEPLEKSVRGTDIILHLKEDCRDYLEEYRVRQIVKKYSDFIEHPVLLDVEREEVPQDKDGNPIEGAKPEKKISEETLNSQKAIWLKKRSEVKSEEYKQFYQHLSHDYSEPFETIHLSAEGSLEFKALLYIPAKAPYDLFHRESNRGIHLYVRRVFIMEDCKKLLPEYLRFIKGVVDSSDLPLNVSREILQEDRTLDQIQKNLVKKILSTLKGLKEKDFDRYLNFYKEFGPVLKEGLHYDYENKEKILDLLLFETNQTASGQYRSLSEYVEKMSKKQKDIYYILAEDRAQALSSPHLEAFKSKGIEVLLLTDRIDEWIAGALPEYEKKNFKPVHQGDLDFDDEKKKEIKEKTEKCEDLFKRILKVVESDVKEIRFSNRLTESISCLVSEEGMGSAQMEAMMKAMGQELPKQKRILELNPNHPLMGVLENEFKKDPSSAKLDEYVQVIFDQAILAEGKPLPDPLRFNKRMSEMMVKLAS